MDRLSRYNQKLLAIIGTTIIVGVALALIIALGGLIISLIDFDSSDNSGLRLQNPQATAKDTTTFVRTQEVSFNSPIQLDTAQAKYIIPVSQVNLETNEKVRFESGSGMKLSGYDYRYESHYGLFNNFILYDHSKGVSKKIFDERISITHWAYLKKDSIEVLLFKGTTTDDNSDNQMDGEDYQNLFAYFIADGRLKKFEFENQTVIGFEPMNKTELVSIQLGTDKDKDFDFEENSEPQEITTLNIADRRIQKIISIEMQREIQATIDGVKN